MLCCNLIKNMKYNAIKYMMKKQTTNKTEWLSFSKVQGFLLRVNLFLEN